ncbi:hypothetical protein BU24DRAFT_121156 [Aaosphaeria arxii CBS 175.79]|uniref:Uncharacterized protein n=1 Tax=Aaosphaeria arxii CBS 175.79 TaxID=1450172 RepID=A0A6A5Y1Q6_9PLEO|nr:uncharacterized protein BU24DRAFT_121156 [Aaosphaeria arxii CBS 175.79]KAF2019495.1 hypothetical protein BU24DRAFT_121156 [Aaosphaeria arxii CBS 175.79]
MVISEDRGKKSGTEIEVGPTFIHVTLPPYQSSMQTNCLVPSSSRSHTRTIDMATRRPHTKSRLGCEQCKTRRVKVRKVPGTFTLAR